MVTPYDSAQKGAHDRRNQMTKIKKSVAVVVLGLVATFGIAVVDTAVAGSAVADPKPCC